MEAPRTIEESRSPLSVQNPLDESKGKSSAIDDVPANIDTIEEESKRADRSCWSWYWKECAWPGMGLFGESYLLFSIGTMFPIWEILFEECFGEDCSPSLLAALHYSVVVGVITGMLVIGYASQYMGRRLGSLITAFFMATGAAGLTLTSIFLTQDQSTLVRSMVFFWFWFGFGVGGEYPMAASHASENGDSNHATLTNQNTQAYSRTQNGLILSNDTPVATKRGRQVQLVFTMQGVGICVNSITMTVLIVITYHYISRLKNENYSNYRVHDIAAKTDRSLLAIWRATYAFGALVLALVWYSRFLYLQESHVWLKNKMEQNRMASWASRRVSDRAASVEASDCQDAQNSTSVEANGTEQGSLHTRTTGAGAVASEMGTITAKNTTGKNAATNQEQVCNNNNRDGIWMQEPLRKPPPLLNVASTVSSLSLPSALGGDDEGEMNYYLFDEKDKKGGMIRTWTLLFRHYGVRLFGVSACWLLWDVAFYGNKLFQSAFLLALINRGEVSKNDNDLNTLLQFSMCATLNAGVALCGYLVAAFLVDQPLIGRRNLQQWGLVVTGMLFVVCGILLKTSASSSWLVITLYLGTSFFGQVGPNCTTFLIPAEIFPTEIRSFCHGIAAASGKIGALIAAVIFNYAKSDLQMFLLSGYASLAAGVLTYWAIPESLGLPLEELDHKWLCITHDKQYEGLANDSRYLSVFERNQVLKQKQNQQDQANTNNENNAVNTHASPEVEMYSSF